MENEFETYEKVGEIFNNTLRLLQTSQSPEEKNDLLAQYEKIRSVFVNLNNYFVNNYASKYGNSFENQQELSEPFDMNNIIR